MPKAQGILKISLHQPLLLLLQKKKEEEEEEEDEEKFPSHLELSTHTPQDVFVPSKDNPERKIQTHVLLDHGQEKKKKRKPSLFLKFFLSK
jgi:hypothetical protein